MDSDAQQERNSEALKSLLLRHRQTPAVEKTVKAGGNKQWRREAVQFAPASIVIVCVGTSGADRVDMTVDQPQRRESG